MFCARHGAPFVCVDRGLFSDVSYILWENTDLAEEYMQVPATGSTPYVQQQYAQPAPAARNEPPPETNEAAPGQNAYGGELDVRA
jgi:hypothetical protein